MPGWLSTPRNPVFRCFAKKLNGGSTEGDFSHDASVGLLDDNAVMPVYEFLLKRRLLEMTVKEFPGYLMYGSMLIGVDNQRTYIYFRKDITNQTQVINQ